MRDDRVRPSVYSSIYLGAQDKSMDSKIETEGAFVKQLAEDC